MAAWYPTIALLVAFIWVLISVLSYRRGGSRPWWPALIMLVACMFCWNVGYFIRETVADKNVALVTSLMIDASKLMAAASALHLATSLSQAVIGWRAAVAGVGYVLAATFFLAGHRK